jgi:hypothetical protein
MPRLNQAFWVICLLIWRIALYRLPAFLSRTRERLRDSSEALIALGGGAENVFEARSQELRATAETQYPLQGLTAAVEAASGRPCSSPRLHSVAAPSAASSGCNSAACLRHRPAEER